MEQARVDLNNKQGAMGMLEEPNTLNLVWNSINTDVSHQSYLHNKNTL